MNNNTYPLNVSRITRIFRSIKCPVVPRCTRLSIAQANILSRKLQASATLPLSGTVYTCGMLVYAPLGDSYIIAQKFCNNFSAKMMCTCRKIMNNRPVNWGYFVLIKLQQNGEFYKPGACRPQASVCLIS